MSRQWEVSESPWLFFSVTPTKRIIRKKSSEKEQEKKNQGDAGSDERCVGLGQPH